MLIRGLLIIILCREEVLLTCRNYREKFTVLIHFALSQSVIISQKIIDSRYINIVIDLHSMIKCFNSYISIYVPLNCYMPYRIFLESIYRKSPARS